METRTKAPTWAVIVDTETDGVDSETCNLLQVAAVVVHLPTGQRFGALEQVCLASSNAAEAVNRLPVELLGHGQMHYDVIVELRAWLSRLCIEHEAVYVAHNADFDRAVLNRHDEDGKFADVVWVCSAMDIRWPGRERAGKAIELALHYGCGVARAHGALDDCMTLAHVLERVRELGHDLGALLLDAMAPAEEVVALVSFDQRELARGAGFYWHPDRKQWRRRIRVEDIDKLPFKVRVVEP